MTTARKLLASTDDELMELRVHEFEDDESAHDDTTIARLYDDFAAEFDGVQSELVRAYGEPSRVGTEDDEAIPLNGVFRFAIWNIDGRQIFVAAAHEDRGVPILLMLGTA